MAENSASLLPPNPEKPGLYYLAHNGGPSRVWEWSADAFGTGGWIAGDGRICRPEHVGAWGYTLATRHRILTPGELEAVHALPDRFKREAREGAEGVQADYRMIAICTAQADADMLRAALGGKP